MYNILQHEVISHNIYSDVRSGDIHGEFTCLLYPTIQIIFPYIRIIEYILIKNKTYI